MRTTVDRVARGELLLEQPAEGYRYNADAVILARFALERCCEPPPRDVVDLGAGCGVIGLLVAQRTVDARIVLVELQPELAELCARNAERNALAGRVETRCEDLRDGAWREHLHAPTLLLCNPPFFRVGEGRLSPKPFVANARHELTLALADLVTAVVPALADARSRWALVYPTAREAELAKLLAAHGLFVHQRRAVRAYPGAPPPPAPPVGKRGPRDTTELDPLEERDRHRRPNQAREQLPEA
ncbi:MAG: methyltransferase [Myxococcales bacterium]|nr:methyltransferase [Myxococcales bacterium]